MNSVAKTWFFTVYLVNFAVENNFSKTLTHLDWYFKYLYWNVSSVSCWKLGWNPKFVSGMKFCCHIVCCLVTHPTSYTQHYERTYRQTDWWTDSNAYEPTMHTHKCADKSVPYISRSIGWGHREWLHGILPGLSRVLTPGAEAWLSPVAAAPCWLPAGAPAPGAGRLTVTPPWLGAYGGSRSHDVSVDVMVTVTSPWSRVPSNGAVGVAVGSYMNKMRADTSYLYKTMQSEEVPPSWLPLIGCFFFIIR